MWRLRRGRRGSPRAGLQRQILLGPNKIDIMATFGSKITINTRNSSIWRLRRGRRGSPRAGVQRQIPLGFKVLRLLEDRGTALMGKEKPPRGEVAQGHNLPIL